MKYVRGALAGMAGIVVSVMAGPENPADLTGDLAVNAMTSIRFGQIVEGKYKGIDFRRQWMHQGIGNITAVRRFGDNFTITVGLEAKMWYNTVPLENPQTTYNPKTQFPKQNYSVYISHGEGVRRFDFGRDIRLRLGIGLVPYKYNPEVRNLGEYLFRTEAYPVYLEGEIDRPFARISGFRAGLRLWDRWDQELLVTTETSRLPFHDFSLTYITHADLLDGVLQPGAGVQAHRLISVDERFTQPKIEANAYLDEDGDTAYYTARATKVMGRLTIDFRPLVGADLLGEEEFKLYTEACVLGVKDYPSNTAISEFDTTNEFGYDKLLEKLPVMVGFSFPTFKALDVLAVEAQWLGTKYPNSNQSMIEETGPLPYKPNSQADYTKEDYTKDDWKWTAYARKSIGKHFSLTGLAARDHIRVNTIYNQELDFEEALTRDSHWYWALKCAFQF